MGETMKAAIYYGARDIRVEEAPVPTPAPGECLVKVIRSGICGTDASEWAAGPRTFPVQQRHPTSGHQGPLILGHEFVGQIVVPDSLSGLSAGDRVASGAGVWCGQCRRCKAGRTNQCERYRTLGLNVHGGMAEYVAVPSQTLRRLPTELSYDHAALAQPLAVGIHAARRAGAQHGDKVVIIGAGAIGSFVLAGIKHLVDVDVTVVDFPGHRLERARRLGADRTIAASPDIVAEIADALGGERPDVVIEASGAPNQLLTALQAVTDGGRVLAVGIPKDKPALDVHSLVFREITLDSTLAHVCDTDLPAALEILSEGIIGVELAEHPLPLDNLGAELDRLVSGKVEGKVLIDPSA